MLLDVSVKSTPKPNTFDQIFPVSTYVSGTKQLKN